MLRRTGRIASSEFMKGQREKSVNNLPSSNKLYIQTLRVVKWWMVDGGCGGCGKNCGGWGVLKFISFSFPTYPPFLSSPFLLGPRDHHGNPLLYSHMSHKLKMYLQLGLIMSDMSIKSQERLFSCE